MTELQESIPEFKTRKLPSVIKRAKDFGKVNETATLIERNDRYAIYKEVEHNQNLKILDIDEYYVVFIIKKEIKRNVYDERVIKEKYPNDSSFDSKGVGNNNAWSFLTLEEAKKKYNSLISSNAFRVAEIDYDLEMAKIVERKKKKMEHWAIKPKETLNKKNKIKKDKIIPFKPKRKSSQSRKEVASFAASLLDFKS